MQQSNETPGDLERYRLQYRMQAAIELVCDIEAARTLRAATQLLLDCPLEGDEQTSINIQGLCVFIAETLASLLGKEELSVSVAPPIADAFLRDMNDEDAGVLVRQSGAPYTPQPQLLPHTEQTTEEYLERLLSRPNMMGRIVEVPASREEISDKANWFYEQRKLYGVPDNPDEDWHAAEHSTRRIVAGSIAHFHGNTMRVDYLYVHPDERRKGWGEYLMTYWRWYMACQQPRKKFLSMRVDRDNLGAQNFLAALGFSSSEERHHRDLLFLYGIPDEHLLPRPLETPEWRKHCLRFAESVRGTAEEETEQTQS